jgi:hypothetical protein
MTRPHPHGQRIPTHQSSPWSRANTRSRLGSFGGRLSPFRTRIRLGGPNLSHAARHHRRTRPERFILERASVQGGREAAPCHP